MIRRAMPPLLLLVLLLVTSATADPPLIESGAPFPELSLPTLDGERLSIRDFRGRKVLLHVFASW